MLINFKKTKLIVFNPCTSIDFSPEFSLDGNDLEVVDEVRLLGLILRSDMKWTSNTKNLVSKANKKLWIIRRLKYLGANVTDLLDIYMKQVRSILELAVPAWSGSITLAEQIDIERVQKSAAHIILGEDYLNYKNALRVLNLDSLKDRRGKLCINFAKKAEKDKKFQNWFRLAKYRETTRQQKFKYKKCWPNTQGFRKVLSVS